MSAEQMLKRYVMEHPDYWDYEDEARIVAMLKEICDRQKSYGNYSTIRNLSHQTLNLDAFNLSFAV